MNDKLFRYTTNGVGIFDSKDFGLYLTSEGKDYYIDTILPLHLKNFRNMKMKIIKRCDLKNIVHEDDWQVVEEIQNA